MTDCGGRFVSSSIEAFKWFEATSSGARGVHRGAIGWADVSGAGSAGEWNGCAASQCARHGRRELTRACRLFGVEMRACGRREIRSSCDLGDAGGVGAAVQNS